MESKDTLYLISISFFHFFFKSHYCIDLEDISSIHVIFENGIKSNDDITRHCPSRREDPGIQSIGDGSPPLPQGHDGSPTWRRRSRAME